ncbi:hypothetical protein GRI89_10240 [Altererythrobacter salegens]|uniref:SnoaL-like domain-containing protein n=1 Tax=Croceibacterium salegens TaxID=1737568 RepID=A0A6I4SWU7_9SPHN|nr:nuclear transport factor 2 family protein [Croceibacterium salegens]MXO59918.1 hypothetical protein [Croceibacterium salegens]
MPRPTVEDELAIQELMARYYRALDTGDTEGYLDCYTADGEATEETSEGTLEIRKGREDIRKLIRKFHERPDFPGHQHLFSNVIFEPDPEGRADHWQVLSYAWATINRPPAKPYLHWCGHIRDIVAREGGEWKIARKDIMGWAGEVLSRFEQ